MGDPGGTSVWYYPPGGPAQVKATRAEIHAACTSLGFTGTEENIDVDALMCGWNEIIFSIRAAANWDGGELVVYRLGGGPAAFLSHGGHLWDTAHNIQWRFHVDTEEVDAIEAVEEGTEYRHQHWNNPDIHNIGATAHDLHVIIEGHPKIKDHFDGYTGTGEIEFQQFQTAWEGSNTKLAWSDPTEPIDECEWVHVGWATWGPHRVLDAYWTDAAGLRIPGGAIYLAKPEAERDEDGEFRFTVRNVFDPGGDPNPDPATITIKTVSYAIFEEPWPLADLNGENTELMDALELLGGPYSIDFGDFVELVMPEEVPNGHAVVLLNEIEDPGTGEIVIRDFAQAMADVEQFIPIPAVTEWGLLVMALLVFAAGTIVFRKLRATAA